MGLSNIVPSGIRAGVCTSTTRPASPYEGQVIYETDTDSVLFWDGTYWESVLPKRNLLYNGAMQVAQRGSSTASITSAGYYTADRWQTAPNSLGTWTQSVENDAPTGSGFRKSLKMLCTTADASPATGDYMIIAQSLEGQDLQSIAKGTSNAQQLTISFWVKSNLTGTYILELRDADNTRQISKSYTINSSAAWEYKTITFPADTTGSFDNDNAASMNVHFWLGAGSTFTSGTLNSSAWDASNNANRVVGQVNLAGTVNNYWQITGVQLNIGSSATPFQFKSFQDELRECQRYYWRFGGDTTYQYLASGWTGSTTAAYVLVQHPVPMRANPNVLDSSTLMLTDTFGNFAVTAITLGFPAKNMTRLDVTTAGHNANRPAVISTNNSTSGYLGLGAEL